MKKIAKGFLLIFSTLLLSVGLVAARVYSYRDASSDAPADAAVVLGAAVWGAEVSPVFRERINHGIDLYRKGRVRKLIFTGGRGNDGEPTESSAARRYALRGGVPAADILIEEESHNTYENILYAKRLADARGLRKVLLVSDPLHMKRAVAMASDLGLAAEPSPTPSTRYRGLRSQAGLLASETYYYIGYLLSRPFLKTARGQSDARRQFGQVAVVGRHSVSHPFAADFLDFKLQEMLRDFLQWKSDSGLCADDPSV